MKRTMAFIWEAHTLEEKRIEENRAVIWEEMFSMMIKTHKSISSYWFSYEENYGIYLRSSHTRREENRILSFDTE